jgi:FAD/FMN-containing dehydrogenase
VIAHGGLTGLVGGALTAPADVVLSLERMNRIEEINAVDRTMTVQAGAVLQTVQEQADAAGLLYPLDLGGRGTATIGGNISTNAGGNRVIRYGMTRDMVLGLEVAQRTARSSRSMNQMIKNNAGYDLKQPLHRLEGSLGIVTRAVPAAQEKPRSQETIRRDRIVREADEFLKTMDSALGGTLSAFEVMGTNNRLLTEPPAVHQPPIPRDFPYYVPVEAPAAIRTRITNARGALGDAHEATHRGCRHRAESAQREQMWAMRDDVVQTFCLRRSSPSMSACGSRRWRTTSKP